MGRSPCCAKEGLKRGAWTATEDRILTEYIKAHGEGKWRNLPKQAGLKRCGKSCRLRWLNYLRPDIKRGNITHDEEELIIRLHKLLGNRWSLIAGRLPGRTDNEIKNYWNTNIGKKTMLQPPPPATSIPNQSHHHQKLNFTTDHQITSTENRLPPPVHHAKPSRCTKVFFPTELQGNNNIQVIETSTRPVLSLGPPSSSSSSSMVQELAISGSDSPPLIASGDPAGFVPDFEMDVNFISEFLINSDDFSELCDTSTDQYSPSSAMEAPLMMINEETLQNPNLFSIDYFLDSEIDWFC